LDIEMDPMDVEFQRIVLLGLVDAHRRARAINGTGERHDLGDAKGRRNFRAGRRGRA
jgi:hypothetical protein